MRLLTYTELTRYSKAELWGLLREAASALSLLPEDSPEYRNALLNWHHIRLFLARRDYAVDDARRHHADVGRKQLEVSQWDGKVFSWLGHELDVDVALEAAEKLFVAIKAASAEAARAPKTLDLTTSAGTVRYVLPDPTPTPEQKAEAEAALANLVRALARQAAREDFERDKGAAGSGGRDGIS